MPEYRGTRPPVRRMGRRGKTAGKYIARRVLLLVLAVGLLGGGGFLVARLIENGGEQSAVSEPPPSSSLPPEPEPEPEPAPEPEPEPEEPAVPVSADDNWQLILASAAHPLSGGYGPPSVESVQGYDVDTRIAPALVQMINDAREEGVELLVCSGYRSEEDQRRLHQNKINEHINAGYSETDAVAAASTIVLPPGYSEHQTGLAVDIVTPEYQMLDDNYALTPAAKWLAENSWEYGFVLRYPADKDSVTKVIYEPWHFRYVGKEHAGAMFEGNLCLEEYLYGR